MKRGPNPICCEMVLRCSESALHCVTCSVPCCAPGMLGTHVEHCWRTRTCSEEKGFAGPRSPEVWVKPCFAKCNPDVPGAFESAPYCSASCSGIFWITCLINFGQHSDIIHRICWVCMSARYKHVVHPLRLWTMGAGQTFSLAAADAAGRNEGRSPILQRATMGSAPDAADSPLLFASPPGAWANLVRCGGFVGGGDPLASCDMGCTVPMGRGGPMGCNGRCHALWHVMGGDRNGCGDPIGCG